MPAVCSALKSKKMESIGSVRITDIKTPPKGQGANFYITYKIYSGEERELVDIIRGFPISNIYKEYLFPVTSIILKKIKQFTKRVQKLSNNPRKILTFIEKVLNKLSGLEKDHGHIIQRIAGNIHTLIKLVRCWINGSYTEVPATTIVSILVALLYFLSPVDIIPDIIPSIGYIDDAVVIMFIISAIEADLDAFKEWERQQKSILYYEDKKRIYITHCSAKKDKSLRGSDKKVTPDKLYTAAPIQRFMNRCIALGVDWAIFSDLYGVWFPNQKHTWYEKSPDKVTDKEFKKLVNDFDQKLQPYDEIWFYHNPGRFHRLYKRLLNETNLRDRVRLFTHISEII